MENRTAVNRLLAAMAAYVILLLGAIWAIRQSILPGWEVLLALLPLLPGIFVVWITSLRIRSMDELQRQIQLEALSLAFGGMFLLLLTEELLGIADLSWLGSSELLIAMSILWLLGQLAARRRYQ